MDVELCYMLPTFDRDLFSKWLASTGSLSSLLKAPLCAEPEAAPPTGVDVIVDGATQYARKESKDQHPEEVSKPKTRKPVRRRKQRKIRTKPGQETKK